MRKRQIGKVFPNVHSTLAYYSPTSFTITLNEISEQEYQAFANGYTDPKQAEKYGVLVHEIRHHLDHISTLWGQNHILKLYKAANARIQNNEFEFHHILPLKVKERQFHYDAYYSYHSNYVEWKSKTDNWVWWLSTGVKFDMQGKPDNRRPILFINFMTPSGQHLTRVPLSIAALLETSAIRDELEIMRHYIQTLKGDEALVEAKLFHQKTFSEIIYCQEMAVYNSIVHLTANTLQLSDMTLALNLSSTIATLVLNLTHNLISRIPIPKNAEDVWKERCSNMVEQHDYGFIFYCVLHNYKDFYQRDGAYYLERLLTANNLPTAKDIINHIELEFHAIAQEVQEGDNFKQLFLGKLEEGKRLFHLRGLDGVTLNSTELLGKHKYCPFVVCSDTDFILEEYLINNTLKLPMDNLTLEQWYSLSLTLDERFDEFYNIRGL